MHTNIKIIPQNGECGKIVSEAEEKVRHNKINYCKKCKRYHKSQLIRNEQPLEQCLSMDSSDTENPDTSESNSEVKTVLFPQNINPFNTYYFPLPKETKEKCAQCTIKTKNSVIQTCPDVRLKCIQTVSTRNLTSTSGTQTLQYTGELVFQQQLLTMLQENNVLAKFAETLYNNGQTQKFVNCIKIIADGKFEVTNLCWKAFLDMGTLFSVKSTTQME